MSGIEYFHRPQLKSQLARYAMTIVVSLRSKHTSGSGSWGHFCVWLSGGSERHISDDCTWLWDGRAPRSCAYPLAIADGLVISPKDQGPKVR
jgi:hypothetical protein